MQSVQQDQNNKAQEVNPLEALFDVNNFFKGTLIFGSILLLTLIGFFFLFPDMRLHFSVMIFLNASLLVIVL